MTNKNDKNEQKNDNFKEIERIMNEWIRETMKNQQKVTENER